MTNKLIKIDREKYSLNDKVFIISDNNDFCCDFTNAVLTGLKLLTSNQKYYDLFKESFKLHKITDFIVYESKEYYHYDFERHLKDLTLSIERFNESSIRSYYVNCIIDDVNRFNSNEDWSEALQDFKLKVKPILEQYILNYDDLRSEFRESIKQIAIDSVKSTKIFIKDKMINYEISDVELFLIFDNDSDFNIRKTLTKFYDNLIIGNIESTKNELIEGLEQCNNQIYDLENKNIESRNYEFNARFYLLHYFYKLFNIFLIRYINSNSSEYNFTKSIINPNNGTKNNFNEQSPHQPIVKQKPEPNGKLITFKNSDTIEKIHSELKGYFQNKEAELLKALKGEHLSEILLFPHNQNKFVEVFRRLKYNCLLLNTDTETKNWICSTFQFVKKGFAEPQPFNESSVWNNLNKGKGEPTKKERICITEWLPYKSPSQLKTETKNEKL